MNRRQLIAAILVLSMLTPTVAAVATAQKDLTRSADLSIQEPHYEDGNVNQQTRNGTRLYAAEGEILEMRPNNFDTDSVVDFGVRGSTGTLTYDRDFDSYQLKPENGTGTYRVYWTVNQPVTVEANETGNETTTKMTTVRYEALVRVTGGTNLNHQSAGTQEKLKEDARNWREFNSTIHAAGFVGPGVTTEEAVQQMIERNKLFEDPLSALTGNLTAVVILLVSTIGGGLVLVGFGVYHEVIVQKLYRKLNIHESIEAEEGTAKETIEELEHREKLQALWNWDWQDIHNDDHVAAAFREVFGETVGEGTEEYLSMFLPRNILRDRLRAMGHDDYVAVVDKRTSADGGDESDSVIADARIEPANLVSDDEETVDLVDATEDELMQLVDPDVLDWDSTTIRTFDLSEADYEAAELDVSYESMDLDTLIEELRADMRHFESPKVFGEMMREFVQTVREHPFTDEHGRPDTVRYTMSQFLETAQLLGDRFDYPLMHFHAEAWERALIDHDPESDAMDVVERVRQEGA